MGALWRFRTDVEHAEARTINAENIISVWVRPIAHSFNKSPPTLITMRTRLCMSTTAFFISVVGRPNAVFLRRALCSSSGSFFLGLNNQMVGLHNAWTHDD